MKALKHFVAFLRKSLAIKDLAHRVLRFIEATNALVGISALGQQSLLRAGYETFLDCFYIFLDPNIDCGISDTTISDTDLLIQQLDNNENSFRAFRFLRFSFFEAFRSTIYNFYFLSLFSLYF